MTRLFPMFDIFAITPAMIDNPDYKNWYNNSKLSKYQIDDSDKIKLFKSWNNLQKWLDTSSDEELCNFAKDELNRLVSSILLKL